MGGFASNFQALASAISWRREGDAADRKIGPPQTAESIGQTRVAAY
jgi:hypothetical protein